MHEKQRIPIKSRAGGRHGARRPSNFWVWSPASKSEKMESGVREFDAQIMVGTSPDGFQMLGQVVGLKIS